MGNEERKFDPTYGGRDETTDAKGQLTHEFMVSPYPCDHPHWYLKLTKEGFQPVEIDIKPHPQPKKVQGQKIPLNVKVEMKPTVK